MKPEEECALEFIQSAQGLASIQVEGRFVDYPIVDRARRLIALAERIAAKAGC